MAIQTGTLDLIKSTSSAIKLCLVIFVPIFSLYFLSKNLTNLQDLNYKMRYGTLYQNVNTDKKSIKANFIFCLRRFLLAFATIYFSEVLILQIMVFTYTNLL